MGELNSRPGISALIETHLVKRSAVIREEGRLLDQLPYPGCVVQPAEKRIRKEERGGGKRGGL